MAPTPELPAVAARLVYDGPRADFWGWSPDSRHMAYIVFTEEQAQTGYFHGAATGTFTFFDTKTDTTCQRYSVDNRYGHEGPGPGGPPYVWLPNGQLLIAPVAAGSQNETIWYPGSERVVRVPEPCGPEEDVTAHFREPIVAFLTFSPTEDRLLVRGVERYWIYDFTNGIAITIEEPPAEYYQNVKWSPDGRHLGLLPLAPQEVGGPGLSHGLGIIEAASGALVASLDFDVYQRLGAPGGGPVWLNDREALVTEIAGGNPTILGVDGSVTSALDRFRMSDFMAEAGAGGTAEDTGWTQGIQLDAQLSAAGDRFHVVTASPVVDNNGAPLILIYHSELDDVEQIPAGDIRGTFIRPDGMVELYGNSEDGTLLVRDLDARGSPATEAELTGCSRHDPQDPAYFAASESSAMVAIYRWPECDDPVMTVRVAGLPPERIGSVGVSPDGRWLAILVGSSYPWRALYLAEVDAGGQ